MNLDVFVTLAPHKNIIKLESLKRTMPTERQQMMNCACTPLKYTERKNYFLCSEHIMIQRMQKPDMSNNPGINYLSENTLGRCRRIMDKERTNTSCFYCHCMPAKEQRQVKEAGKVRHLLIHVETDLMRS